jgi:uncharacterized protein (DUF302 family)
MNDSVLECRAVRPDLAESLAHLFERLHNAGAEVFFIHSTHPAEALKRAKYQGKDLYYVLADGRSLIGYGMLAWLG